MAWFTWFSRIGPWLRQAFNIIREVVGDDVLKMALDWARVAAERELTNELRREFVVKMLMARGVPESIARLATEMAVQLIKRELRKAAKG